MEASPADDQIPGVPSSTARSVVSRTRSFSTFASASRFNTDFDNERQRVKLSDIMADSASPFMIPEGSSTAQTFIKRMAHYEFNLHKPIKNMRILFCKNLDEGVYERQEVGKTLGDSVRMRPTTKSFSVGDKNPYELPGNPQTVEQIVYLLEDVAEPGLRHLYVFFIYGEDDKLILKAKAVLMTESNIERLEYISAHMAERNERLHAMAREIASHKSVFGRYESRDFGVMMQKNQQVVTPPVKYLLGKKDALLAFRTFEPINKDSIMVNVIMVVTETVFALPLASNLSTMHPIRVVIMALRGFGYSGGRRGHTPTANAQYYDISQMVRHVKSISEKPVLLGGYAFAGAIILNYDQYKERELVDGYISISPILGFEWRYAWRKELWQMKRDRTLDIKMGWLKMARLTKGLLGGGRYVVNMNVSDQTYDFTPLLSNRMTANFVRTFQVGPKRFRKGFSAPLAFFTAENDEFLDPNAIKKRIEPYLKGESQYFYKEGQTGLGMLMTIGDEVVEWIMGLEVVRTLRSSAKNSYATSLNLLNLGTLKTFIPSAIYASVKKGLETGIYDNQPQGTDANDCKYDYWEPSNIQGRPSGVFLILAPRFQTFWLPDLVETYRIAVFRVDPWQQESDFKVSVAPKTAWRSLGHVLRMIKVNFPATPLFIGGIGYGASLVLGYIQGQDHEPVNGCILINPSLDVKASDNQVWVQDGPAKSDVPDLSTLLFDEPSPADTRVPKSQRKLLEVTGYVVSLVRDSRSLFLSKDIVGEIKKLTVPTAVFLPLKHSYLRTISLSERLKSVLRPPFNKISCLPGDLAQILPDLGCLVGKWLSEVSLTVAPRASLAFSGATSINDFEPIEMIGKGTYGRVWLVRHSRSNRLLALKVLDKAKVVMLKQVKQVMRERKILSECSACPFIVTFIGSFQDSKRLFLAMEFLVGGELFTRLRSKGRLTVEEARFYVSEVLVAMIFLHERGIVYRDIKPENMVLDAMGHVNLVDFGFARHLQPGRRNSFCGSPYYVAPEMIASGAYGQSVDAWALGVLVYELLVGSPPFEGKNANAVYKNIVFSRLEPPPFLNPDSIDLIKRLLDPSPETRLGCTPTEGIAEITKHRWFRGIDWDRVRRKQIPPPYQPPFTFEGDTTNFMTFAGATLEVLEGGPDQFEGLFRGY